MKHIRHHFATLPSTNTWAKKHSHMFDKRALTLITADEQTEGRGRFDRTWVSPANMNIYATFCFTVPPHYAIANIPQVLALTVANVLENKGFAIHLKWPNDILIKGKKVGGILCETTYSQNSVEIVLGIGLNINMPKEFLDNIDRPATSLKSESGKEYNIEDIIATLYNTFSEDLSTFLINGFAPFLRPFRSKMSQIIGEHITFDNDKNMWEGVFHCINDDGSITIELSSGELKAFYAGEIP